MPAREEVLWGGSKKRGEGEGDTMPSRCKIQGCDKHAKAGGHCIAHGGGRRCQTEGCDKHASKKVGHCIAHGGGRRCQTEGCDKQAQGGGRCKAHGGGRRRKVGTPSIPEAPEGLSEDEEHHVDLVEGEGEGEDEVVDTQVRCVW